MSEVLTLSDVLSRAVLVEWPESVAVVRGVVAWLLEHSSRASLVPELEQIQIFPTGRIDVSGAVRVDEPVRRLGQLLQATLGTSDPPVQLRLAISQATAPTPAFRSILEFDKALEYFERPDRNAVVQALYVRADAAPPLSDSTSTPKLDAIAPLPTGDASKKRHTRATLAAKRRALRLLSGIALFFVISLAGLQYARISGVWPTGRDVSSVARHASDAVGAAVLSGLSAVTERSGLGRLVPADAPGGEAPATAAAPPAATSAVKKTPPVRANVELLPFRAFDLQTLSAPPERSAVAPETVVPTEPARPSELSVPEPQGYGALTIYSPESTDVLPPVTLRPQLPTELPPGIRREDLMAVELIVLPDGSVESVRFLGQLRRMHDVMWLSAVKAWQFQPAMKDGLAVKYRKTVWIASE